MHSLINYDAAICGDVVTPPPAHVQLAYTCRTCLRVFQRLY